MSIETPLVGTLLVLGAMAITWAARLAPGRQRTPRAIEGRLPNDAEPCDFAWCVACGHRQYSAMHEDGAHTCFTCLTTTAGDQ